MASTFKPSRAFDYCSEFIKRMNMNDVGYIILDHALKHLWMAAPWRWTIGALTPVTLASNTDDYTVSLPNDFLYITRAQMLVDGKDGARELSVEPFIPDANGVVGQPSTVALTSTTNLRVFPTPGTLTGTNRIVLQYKKKAPEITKRTMYVAGTQVFDDEWFPVYVQGVLYHAYLYADDNRAGSAQMSGGGTAYTGQLGVYRSFLNEMAMREKLPSYPEDRKEPTIK